MSNQMPPQFTSARLRRYSLALALGLCLGWLLFLVAGQREGSAVLRGDFPAFYAAAELVWSGQGGALYDFERQRVLENRLWPDFAGDYYVFAYPPFFALLLAPLAALSPLAAKALTSLLLVAALLGALRLLRPISDFVRQQFAFTLVYLLTFAPLQISLVGVQNTALTLLLFALVHWAAQAGRPLVMGLAAALLLYKPQFGALLLVYLLAWGWGNPLPGGGLRALVMGWGLGALALYLLGAVIQGWDWPLAWLTAAGQFGDANFVINDTNMISLAGLVYWMADRGLELGAAALPLAYLAAAVLLVLSAAYVRRDPARLVLVPPLVLLLSPQTLFYDVTLALQSLILILRPGQTRDFLLLSGIWLYGNAALLLRDTFDFPLFAPLLWVLLAMLVLGERRLTAPGNRP